MYAIFCDNIPQRDVLSGLKELFPWQKGQVGLNNLIQNTSLFILTGLMFYFIIFHQELGDENEPLELQESGYFASESMSVVHDPPSEPLSSQYFANTQGPHDRSRASSLPHTR